jgi:putative ABC transport system permease protein
VSGAAAGALLSGVRRRPGRLLLTGVAITVATVFAAGTLLLSETLRGYLAARTQVTPVAAAAVVHPGGSLAADPGLVAAVAGVPGVDTAIGHWTAVLPVAGGGPPTTWQLQSDPMTGPLSRLGPPTAGRLPTGPDQVLVGAATAERTGVRPGAALTVTPAAGPPRTVTVTGVVRVPLEGLDLLVGLPDAVGALGGELDQVDVLADAGTAPAALVERIGPAIGDPDAVRTGAQQRVAEAENASETVSDVLIGVGIFVGLAMVAAAVVVASTFRILLTQRRTQFALLRCVGARRGQVLRAVLLEALVTGLVAGALGVAVAVLAGYGLVAALAATGTADAPALVVSWPGMAGCLLLAVLSTVLAAVGPALAAARIPPLAALRAAGAGESGAPPAVRRLVLAGLLVAIAVAAGVGAFALSGPQTGGPALLLLAGSGLVAFAALLAAGPLLVRALAATLGRAVSALGGAPGRLATANAGQVPRRTAATISVLALGVGLTSALLVALSSTEGYARAEIADRFPAEIVVATPDAAALAGRLGADPAVVVVPVGDSAVGVDPAPGTDGVAARRAVETALAGQTGAVVQYAGDVRHEVETQLATMRAIGLALVGMTVLVAVVGVAVTLMLSVTERTRETGLLRALGLTRAGARRTVAWEAALAGAGAALLGAVIGGLYGLLGARVLRVGDQLEPAVLPQLAGLVVGVVALAVLAAVLPAARAGRVPPIRALLEV